MLSCHLNASKPNLSFAMTATICAQLSQHTLSLAGLLQQVERVCAVEPQVGALVQGVGITYRVLASRTGCWHHVQGAGITYRVLACALNSHAHLENIIAAPHTSLEVPVRSATRVHTGALRSREATHTDWLVLSPGARHRRG